MTLTCHDSRSYSKSYGQVYCVVVRKTSQSPKVVPKGEFWNPEKPLHSTKTGHHDDDVDGDYDDDDWCDVFDLSKLISKSRQSFWPKKCFRRPCAIWTVFWKYEWTRFWKYGLRTSWGTMDGFYSEDMDAEHSETWKFENSMIFGKTRHPRNLVCPCDPGKMRHMKISRVPRSSASLLAEHGLMYTCTNIE